VLFFVTFTNHMFYLFWLCISMSAHSQPLNLHHTVYIIGHMVLASAGGNPQNKDTIYSIFSPKCNTIYKCEIHFNHWISFLYLHINIYVMMISSFCKFKLHFSVSIRYHKISYASWNNVPWWQTLIPMDQHQRHTSWQQNLLKAIPILWSSQF
jgi:hypothetical protein